MVTVTCPAARAAPAALRPWKFPPKERPKVAALPSKTPVQVWFVVNEPFFAFRGTLSITTGGTATDPPGEQVIAILGKATFCSSFCELAT